MGNEFMGTVKRMEARGRTHQGGLKQGGTNSTARAGGRRARGVPAMVPPQCHPGASHGAPQWVLTMGRILGWGSPSIWDAGAAPGAGQERCRAKALGGPLRPPEQSTRGCARHRAACRWTQHRGYNHGGTTRSPHTQNMIAAAPREPRHRHTRAWTRSPPARTHA